MIIAVTGNFGVGKTTVVKMLGDLGAKVIDADKISHHLIESGSSVYKKVVSCFGKKILSGQRGAINRKRLAEVVFNDSNALKKLNAIMHPEIIKEIKNRIKEYSDKDVIVVDAALLIEWAMSFFSSAKRELTRDEILPWADKLVVVKSASEIQRQRLLRCGFSRDDIDKRLSVQLSQGSKVKFADFVIDNSGMKRETKKQVNEVWRIIIKEITG